MNTQNKTRYSHTGRFFAALGLALAVNAAMATAMLHTPTAGQRYLAAAASAAAPAMDLADATCVDGRV